MQSNPFDLAGKVIIVTGACGTLGPDYVTGLLAAGAKVVAWDRSEEKLAQLSHSHTDNLVPQVVDVTDEKAVADAVHQLLDLDLPPDGLINNVGMNPAMEDRAADRQFAPYTEYPIDLFRREMDVNVTGTMIATKFVAPIMIERRTGSIVNVASEIAVIAHDHRVYQSPGRYKSPAYAASKAAVVGLTRQWAAYLGEFGVRVNAISPGGVRNERVPEDFATRFGAMNMLGRMARMGEYVPTMIYLLSDASSFMTGANLVIDGGKSAW